MRCTLDTLAPDDFVAIVDGLLAAYDFHKEQQLDAELLLALQPGQEARLYIGTLYTTWEWVFQAGTEFGFGENTALRSEGQVFRAFGRVGVLIDARPDNNPEPSPRVVEGIETLRASGTEELLVFTNADDLTRIHPYRAVAGDLWTVPQGLGSLAYNLLTSTLVFMEHEHRLRWSCVNYRW